MTTKEHEVYKLLLELNSSDTWEGVNHRQARGIMESYAKQIVQKLREQGMVRKTIHKLVKLVNKAIGYRIWKKGTEPRI